MTRPPISATIITLNEESRLPRAIQSLKWVDEIIVVDAGSTDRTVEIAKEMGAQVFQQEWRGFGQQKNFAQAQAKHDWVLNIDADEEVPAQLAEEIQKTLVDTNGTVGFYLPRKTFYLGRWIMHGGWYPNYLVRLAHRQHAKWTEPHVHEELKVEGSVKRLQAPLEHYTFRNIEDQILTNLKYSRAGYLELLKKKKGASFLRLILKPIGKFLETYILKRGFLDGIPGLIISVNAAHSIFLKYAYFYDEDPHYRQ